jgi:hypothetical protein
MPAPAAETTTTRSTCTAETARGTHVFDICGYSLHKGMGADKFISSATFSVGGHDWAIHFYPDGPRSRVDVHGGGGPARLQYLFVYLVLLSEGATVRATCALGLVHPATGLPATVHSTAEPRVFKYGDLSMYFPHGAFLDRGELEASSYLVDDRLTIHCAVSVIKEPRVSSAPAAGVVGGGFPATAAVATQNGELLPAAEKDAEDATSFSKALINLMRAMKSSLLSKASSSLQPDDKVRVQGVLLL